MNNILVFDALEDDEEIIAQYDQSLTEWGFSENGQMIQVEDSVTNETFHVSVTNDNVVGELQFKLGDRVVLLSSKRQRV